MKYLLIALLFICSPAHAALDPSDFHFDWRTRDKVFLHDTETRQVWLLQKCRSDIYNIRCPECKGKMKWLRGRKIWKCETKCNNQRGK